MNTFTLTDIEKAYIRTACSMQSKDIKHDLEHGGVHGHVQPDQGRGDSRRALVKSYEDLVEKFK